MYTAHISILRKHIHTQLPHVWTKDCPQRRDKRINGEENEELKRRRRERRRAGGKKYTSCTKSLNRP